VDPRLVPINGLIALLRGDGGWPALLGQQGFQRHSLEGHLITEVSDTRVDAVIYRRDPDLVLLAECKSGGNIDERQARKYEAATVADLRRTDLLPSSLRRTSAVAVAPLFVGIEQRRADLEAGLRRLKLAAPLLTVGPNRVRLSDASGIDGLDDFDQAHDAGLPPARLRVDHQSADAEIRELVLPEIVAAQAREEDIVGIESVCQAILPEWAILAPGARGDFIRKVEGVDRLLAADELRGSCRLERGVSGQRSRIVIDSTPASKRPQGRTQAWQAQQRRAARGLRGRARAEIEGQTSLDDLAAEGGLADE
jgi:hypothetical protein